VKVGNGESTSLWYDAWDGDDLMADLFPELHSHCKNQELLVAQACQGGLEQSLVSRRSNIAEEQLVQMQEKLTGLLLTDRRDQWCSPLLKRGGSLDTTAIYGALKNADSS
jgi:hypothetical protein